jgi:hypothetical protein
VSPKLKICFATLAFLVLLAAQVFGTDALRWYKRVGGPTGGAGIVNLPLAAKSQCLVYTNTGIAREGHIMLNLARGVVLNTPADMSGSVVAVTSSLGIDVSSKVVFDGSISVRGTDMMGLRNNGVTRFEINIIDIEDTSKTMRIEFQLGASNSYKIFVW